VEHSQETKSVNQEAVRTLAACMADLVDLQCALLHNGRDLISANSSSAAADDKNGGQLDKSLGSMLGKRKLIDNNNDEKEALQKCRLFMDEIWEEQTKLDQSVLGPFRDESIEKWNKKVLVSGGGSSLLERKFRAFNQSIPRLIENMLTTDRERLVKRTRLYRGQAKRLGRWAADDNNNDKNGNDQEIFDDGDFYAVVLRELIDSKISDSTDSHKLGMQWAKIREMQQRNRKHRDNVDRRASKGRKLR
jgi:hypothetical protein